MPKRKVTPKRVNRQDLTLRNLRALKKRVGAIETEVLGIDARATEILTDLAARVTALETDVQARDYRAALAIASVSERVVAIETKAQLP